MNVGNLSLADTVFGTVWISKYASCC